MDIRNGYLTGRKVGDSGTNLGLEVLNGTDQGGNRFNYVLHTRDGKIFRFSSVYFHNDEGKVIGSLCVNLDITETIRFEEYLKGYNPYDLGDAGNTSSEEAKEIFVNDVTQIIDFLFHEGVHKIGCQPKEMNREQKMEFLRFLDKKGAFLISKSNERVCVFFFTAPSFRVKRNRLIPFFCIQRFFKRDPAFQINLPQIRQNHNIRNYIAQSILSGAQKFFFTGRGVAANQNSN